MLEVNRFLCKTQSATNSSLTNCDLFSPTKSGSRGLTKAHHLQQQPGLTEDYQDNTNLPLSLDRKGKEDEESARGA